MSTHTLRNEILFWCSSFHFSALLKVYRSELLRDGIQKRLWGGVKLLTFRAGWSFLLTFNIRETFTYDNRQCFCCLCFHAKLSDLNFHTARCPLAGLFVRVLRRVSVAKQILAICGVAVPQADWLLRAWRGDQARLIGRRRWNGGAADVLVRWIRNGNRHLVLGTELGTAALFALERRHWCDTCLVFP